MSLLLRRSLQELLFALPLPAALPLLRRLPQLEGEVEGLRDGERRGLRLKGRKGRGDEARCSEETLALMPREGTICSVLFPSYMFSPLE